MAFDEIFWADEPMKLLTENSYLVIIPTNEMNFATQLNSATRFALYFSILMSILKRDIQPMFLLFLFMTITLLMFRQHSASNKSEQFLQNQLNIEKDMLRKQYVYKPNKNNPFMNVSLEDLKTFPNRPRAANILKPHVKKRVNKLFEDGQYHDERDIFDRNTSARQFYTNPITTIPNDQHSFAHWLYGIPGKTCKEGNGERCMVTQRLSS